MESGNDTGSKKAQRGNKRGRGNNRGGRRNKRQNTNKGKDADGNEREYDPKWMTNLRKEIREDPDFEALKKPKDMKKPDRGELQGKINKIKKEIEEIPAKIDKLKKDRTNWRRGKNQAAHEISKQKETDNKLIGGIYDKLKKINERIKKNAKIGEKKEIEKNIEAIKKDIDEKKKGILSKMRANTLINRIEDIQFTLANENLTAMEEKKHKTELESLTSVAPDAEKIQELEALLPPLYEKRKKLAGKVKPFYQARDAFVEELKDALGPEEWEKRQKERKENKGNKGKKRNKKEHDKKETKEDKEAKEAEDMVEDDGFGKEETKEESSPQKGRSPRKKYKPGEPREYEEGDTFSPKIDDLFQKRRDLRDKISAEYEKFDELQEQYRWYVYDLKRYEFCQEIFEQKVKRDKENEEKAKELKNRIGGLLKKQIEQAKEADQFKNEKEDCDFLIEYFTSMDPRNKPKTFKLKEATTEEGPVEIAETKLKGKLSGMKIMGKRSTNTDFSGQMNVVKKKGRKRKGKKKGKKGKSAVVEKDNVVPEKKEEEKEEEFEGNLDDKEVKLESGAKKLFKELNIEEKHLPVKFSDLASTIAHLVQLKAVFNKKSEDFKSQKIEKFEASLTKVEELTFEEAIKMINEINPRREGGERRGGRGGRGGRGRRGGRGGRGGRRGGRRGERREERREDRDEYEHEEEEKPKKKKRIAASNVKVNVNDDELFPSIQ